MITRGTRIGWLVSEVSLLASALECGMPLVNASYFLVEEGQIVSKLVEIHFEFVCTEFESLVK